MRGPSRACDATSMVSDLHAQSCPDVQDPRQSVDDSGHLSLPLFTTASASCNTLDGRSPVWALQDVCKKYNIPTAAYETFTDAAAAKEYIRSQVLCSGQSA